MSPLQDLLCQIENSMRIFCSRNEKGVDYVPITEATVLGIAHEILQVNQDTLNPKFGMELIYARNEARKRQKFYMLWKENEVLPGYDKDFWINLEKAFLASL